MDLVNVKIVTDTNSGITPAQADAWGVALVSMPFMIDGAEYLEGRGLTHAMLFDKMRAGAAVSTAQPSPGDLLAVWDEALETCDQLVYIPMTSGLSSSCASAKALALDYDGRVFVADNHRISVPMCQSVRDAVRYAAEGLDGAAICQRLEQEGLYHSIYITVDKLDYLKRGGRVTAATALLGTALNIKPILALQGGQLDACGKVRGMKAARAWMVDAIRRDYEEACRTWPGRVQVMAAYSETQPDVLQSWLDQIAEAFPGCTVDHAPLPLSICCHTGPGALGVGICAADIP
jgi:DegV family protein with EDD domain